MPARKKASPTNSAKSAPAAVVGPIFRVILFVKDVRATAAWYQKIFELQPVGEITKEWGEVATGTCNIAFHRCPSNQAEGGDSHVKICFAAADVPAAKALLESRGAKLGPAKEFPGLSLCDGLDPEGNRFQLSSRGVS